MNHTENLIFSLNATMPVFLMMVLGYVLHRKTPLLNDQFANYLNTFVFKLALPVQLFKSLSQEDFHEVWDGGMVLFCFGVSLASILLLLGLSAFLRDRSLRAEFVQAGYRGSQALLALGACIDPKKAAGCWKPTLTASLFKLVFFVVLFLPLAVKLGYRGETLTALLIMLGSPATVSCFSMARSMGHEGTLSASAVMLTTVCSAFTFTVWLYVLKSLALI